MADLLTIRRPDDWHLHLRDGAALKSVLPYTAQQFARAIVMPNLTPPVTTAVAANAYRDRILAALPAGLSFTPLMVAYLTNGSNPDDLAAGFRDGAFVAAKLYPAHATTNSAAGVTDIRNIDAVLERMAEIGMPLLVHGEVTDPSVDIFDREAVFIDKILVPLVNRLPTLRVVFEHATTERAVEFVRGGGANIGCTITPHHLLLNRNAMFQGGIRPHHYCLPVVKREKHRVALVEAATSGDPHFFLGTDSAPHAVSAKEQACGCAGIFNAPTAIELYAEVFDAAHALDRLEGFASLNGPRFYGLPVNEQRITLERSPMTVPDAVALPDGGEIRPFRAGEQVAWRIAT
ncbi:MAG TPA: dihydroorotase [Alphaproteobacteria bacterium]|jgi:dihydroorotase|nr:dihydroorotase [Alphaproteobacteria bacterium]